MTMYSIPLLASEVDDFLQRCSHNLRTLQSNLVGIGYHFLRPNGPFQLANDQDREAIGEAEKRFGQLPTLLRRWFETFRYVDFSQDSKQFDDRSVPLAGLGYNMALVFPEIGYCIQYQGELSQSGRVVRREDGKHFLPFGTFASNCEPKGVWLPDHLIDPILYDDGGGPVSFSQELRNVFATGGFPFWRTCTGGGGSYLRWGSVQSTLSFATHWCKIWSRSRTGDEVAQPTAARAMPGGRNWDAASICTWRGSGRHDRL